ncbi:MULTISPECIES: M20 metallopeptidase family protein [unclassified Rhizobium]|uniref:M20 metallopeptidase family protein n=2 Tax=Rhizobium TaxID=379 RepID=UPI001ADB1114|nr:MULTISPECIES: M20 family metallopeptidase [unclassified Rhizobium]MBO9101325.1 amidohydrolase [Rhizobium sp. L58/93]QXZ86883.1 amidohydrolase [Rhizobium sp. K1/93]QXZ93084.1 amidohydrolase [Rhizobium sp. K15/93]
MLYPSNDPTKMIEDLLQPLEQRLIEIRRDIHAHPEIGFDTFRTAQLVADELRALGLDPKTGVGRTGVVATITGGRPGPCVILRADMDALPIAEQTGLAFASTIPGAMHACGHDIHTAALLGAASALSRISSELAGSIRLIFQPAEETQESGAAAMIADGAADGADLAVAFHNRPETPAGKIVLNRGASTASSDEFKVIVHGKSGHAARPHAAIDPIVAAAHMITQLQTLISREMDPSTSAVLTIGHIQGGATQNIIPDSCMFEGTVRCRSPESRDLAEASFSRICQGAAAALNVSVDIDYVRGAPPLMNDDRLVDRATEALGMQFGVLPLVEQGSSFGAEDFSYFSERLPSIQIFIGSGQPGRDDRVHNSDYQPDESCIKQSAIALTRVAVELLT